MSSTASSGAGEVRAGQMIVLSGPSGCGKSSIAGRLLEDPRYRFSVSATTRKPRAGEVDGRDYFFLSAEDFRHRVERGEFIEYAEVHGNMYGTLREPVEAARAAGVHVLLDIDVQGALQLKALGVPGLYVFIAPPSFEELRRRLVGRGTDPPEVIERRLRKAEDEYRERVKYDHVVVNDDLGRAVDEARGLIEARDAGADVSNVLLAVSGSVAVYKACDLASKLAQADHAVRTVLTRRAAHLVSPQLFEAVTGQPSYVDEFDASRRGAMDHIDLADWTEVFAVAPCTANLLARFALGLADDLVTTAGLALEPEVPRLLCPAMNPSMLMAPAIRRHLEQLAADGWRVMEPGEGHMACGVAGRGRLPEPAEIAARIEELAGS